MTKDNNCVVFKDERSGDYRTSKIAEIVSEKTGKLLGVCWLGALETTKVKNHHIYSMRHLCPMHKRELQQMIKTRRFR